MARRLVADAPDVLLLKITLALATEVSLLLIITVSSKRLSFLIPRCAGIGDRRRGFQRTRSKIGYRPKNPPTASDL